MNKKKVIEILENKYGWEGLGEARNVLLDDSIEATKEAFSLNIVSQQRELLKAYTLWLDDKLRYEDELNELIDSYLNSL